MWSSGCAAWVGSGGRAALALFLLSRWGSRGRGNMGHSTQDTELLMSPGPLCLLKSLGPRLGQHECTQVCGKVSTGPPIKDP